jgi:pyrimidine-nucleoside phosphorylase
MRAVDIIVKKRDCQELTTAEIEYFIHQYATENIPDYQAAAFAMAVFFNGMTPKETTDLTLAIVNSGDTLDLSGVVDIAVDKHSTGGVGDKTTLVVEPLVSACGLPVGKMSGRGLGFSGGTLDKLESIPGYRCNLTTDEFLDQLKTVGIVLTGQTADLAPADGKLYALRDVTGTVQSIPLIASSVMSKKLAAGAQAIVLDVKCGFGAFMSCLGEAEELATLMVDIAKLAGRKAVALLSDMNQPLGVAVGNALELKEAIATLRGAAPPPDFLEHCLEVATHMLALGGIAPTAEAARPLAEAALADGRAWSRFRVLVAAQGGDTTYIDQPDKLPCAQYIETISAPHSGYLSEINARVVGETVVSMGCGRAQKGDQIDYAVGVEIFHNVGDQIKTGDPLFAIHANDLASLATAKEKLLAAHIWSETSVEPLPLFYGIVE